MEIKSSFHLLPIPCNHCQYPELPKEQNVTDVSELKGRVASLKTKAEKASQDSEEIKGKLETILTQVQGPRELGNSCQPRGYQANRYQGEDPRNNGNRNQSYQNRNAPNHRNQARENRYHSERREVNMRPMTDRPGNGGPPARA